ncbi:hypothetical protein [Mucilaginibacter polytrichastri]|uniref:Uncharacterized protein n=1 Tax=Mucilaginibacter polytrichastri TaxID=1302689 RepID=A0A1Q5ZWI5_9SPHI|nr:hypothetical protein [Mucilaginibacter polytrichastri]OKS86129.1 hypothetical protein RG47T_1579 [Mucilaginibacter polytrichastri]SFS58395.1 hypothetical protein SAMN04487890_10212 [Mucilaginibacter polytrichastri]
MNRTNLENLKGELKGLKFDDKYIKKMEEMMEKGLPSFELKGLLPVDKGQMDMTMHFKKSGQSDYYYFNKFDLAYSKAKPLEGDLKYLVVSPGEKNKNLVKPFDSPSEAIAFFKSQTGKSELAIGKHTDKDLQFRDTVATMAEGKVDYVKKEFQQTYYSPALTNSHYVEKGVGFNLNQASNMLQGRSAYRDDLVSRAGVEYKAWNVIQFDQPKDKYGNYQMKQFNENYGFDAKKALEDYRIKLPEDGKKLDAIISELKDGGRPTVPVIDKEGKEVLMKIEAVPRYGNLNFHHLNGKPQNREELLKEPKKDLTQGKDAGKTKDKAQAQEMSM